MEGGFINIIEGRERVRSSGVGVGTRNSIGALDDLGGKWEREDMGMALGGAFDLNLNFSSM